MTALEYAEQGLANAKEVLKYATQRVLGLETSLRQAVEDEEKAKGHVKVLEDLVRLARGPREIHPYD